MQKHKAHYNLKEIKRLVSEGKYKMTLIAKNTALNDFNLEGNEIAKCIMNLTINDFYKSMTSRENHKFWHDVYKPMIKNKKAYVKLQIVEEKTVIISFKES